MGRLAERMVLMLDVDRLLSTDEIATAAAAAEAEPGAEPDVPAVA